MFLYLGHETLMGFSLFIIYPSSLLTYSLLYLMNLSQLNIFHFIVTLYKPEWEIGVKYGGFHSIHFLYLLFPGNADKYLLSYSDLRRKNTWAPFSEPGVCPRSFSHSAKS